MRESTTAVGAALVLIALASAPWFLSPYNVTLLIPAMAFGIALLGLNLLFGYTGLLSFGHALFIGVGAYTAAVLTSKLGVRSLELVLLTSVIAALVFAIPIGLLSVRYIGIFFGMLTLAFGMLFHSFLFKFYDLTGGDSGMRIVRPALLGNDYADLSKTAYLVGPFFYYVLALLVVLGFIMWRIVHSPFGLHLKALRGNARKAEYLGVTVRRFRLYAFVMSASYCSIAGVIIGIPTGLADPELAYWTQSGNLIFMMLLGGFTNFFGPLLGAFTFTFLQDQLMTATEYWRLFLGCTLLLIVIVFPRGLMGLMEDAATRMRRTLS